MAKIPGTSAKTKTYTDEAGKLKSKSRATSPDQIYSGRSYGPGGQVGDGLSTKKQAAMEKALQKPQDHDHDGGESRAPSYDCEIPNDGPRAWLRGGGSGHRPKGFDAGPVHGTNPIKGAKPMRGGGNCEKSPFSDAHFNYTGKK